MDEEIVYSPKKYRETEGATVDKDGDILFTTNNKVLLDNWRYTPSIICNQRSAPKSVVTDELLRQSNKAGFGDEIGSTTNKITAMYDVQSDFAVDSEEYKALAYRIQCGQLYQQNCIDKLFSRCKTW